MVEDLARTVPDLEEYVAYLEAVGSYLTESQAIRLLALGNRRLPEEDGLSGAGFDLKEEVDNQIRAVRAMRNKVINQDGSIRESISVRDVKEVVAASNTMLGSLMKHQKDILSLDRQRAVESAMIETLKELDERAAKDFLARLEQRLEQI